MYSCVSCGEQAQEWSFQYPPGWSVRYSDDPNDYAPMCRSCHRKFDLEVDPILAGSLAPLISSNPRTGAEYAHLGGAAYARKASEDPELASRIGRLGAAALHAKSAADPELARKLQEVRRANGGRKRAN